MPDDSIWDDASEQDGDENPAPVEKSAKKDPVPNGPIFTDKPCFPSDSRGMPKALEEIPADELSWFWKNMRYRGHFVAHVPIQDEHHEYLFEQGRDRAFYVKSPKGTIGLVPFPCSTVVWPHEAGWIQDLAPENKGKPRIDPKTSLHRKPPEGKK